MMKRYPVKVPISETGTITEIIDNFINLMEEVTGGDVLLDCKLDGTCTIYFNTDPEFESKSKAMDVDLDEILREEKLSQDDLHELFNPSEYLLSL